MSCGGIEDGTRGTQAHGLLTAWALARSAALADRRADAMRLEELESTGSTFEEHA